jgi:hypothetical protein
MLQGKYCTVKSRAWIKKNFRLPWRDAYSVSGCVRRGGAGLVVIGRTWGRISTEVVVASLIPGELKSSGNDESGYLRVFDGRIPGQDGEGTICFYPLLIVERIGAAAVPEMNDFPAVVKWFPGPQGMQSGRTNP